MTTKTHLISQTALGAAVIAVLASLSLPTHPVPFTLLTFGIGLVATLLPPKQAVTAGGLYLLLGAIGLPVFANGTAGIQVLAGPTAGYLWGIPIYLFITAVLTTPSSSWLIVFLANLLGDGLLFVCGWLGLQFLAGLSPQAAFLSGILPFIFFELIKLTVIAFLSQVLFKLLGQLVGKR